MGRKRRTKRRKSRSRRTKKQGNFNLKRGLFILVLLFFVVYISYLLIVLTGVSAKDPLAESLSSHNFLSTVSSDLERTVFVMERGLDEQRAISDIYVFLNNPRKENSILIYIPGTLHFSGLEEDFGSPIPISSLRYAGEFLQEGMGVEYTLWQLNEILGFRLNDYVWITSEAYDVIEEVYGSTANVRDRFKEEYTLEGVGSITDSFLKLHTMSSQYSFLRSVFNASQVAQMEGQIYSNLPFLSALGRIGSFENSVRNSRTQVMDFSSPRFSSEDFSDQGGPIRMINISEYDKTLRRNNIDIIDREVERERVRIEVYNGSSIPGRAGRYARKILNNCCDVVRFGNAPKALERTQIYISDAMEFNSSLEVVEDIFFGRYKRLEERPSFMTTGDIVIILGEDVSQLELF